MLQNNSELSQVLKNKKLLIVDDDKLFSEMFKEMLEEWFLYIRIAHDAKEALEALDDVAFDLIITDIDMPGIDGVQLCHEIRKNFYFRKIVVVSSYSSEKYLIELLNVGVHGYLKKPFKINTLRDLLTELFLSKTKDSHAE